MAGAMGRPRWSAGELATARPDVVAAARWELYVHRIWPAKAAESLAGPDEPPKKDVAARMRRDARTALNNLRRILTLVDEPDAADLPQLGDDATEADVEALLRDIEAQVAGTFRAEGMAG